MLPGTKVQTVLRLMLLAIVCLASSSAVMADQFFFSQSGFINGLPVSATADFTGTAGTNTLTLVLTNTSTGHTSVAQALVGIKFFLCDAQGNLIPVTVTSISSQTGRLISFPNSETATDVGANGAGVDTLHWGLNATLGVTALGFSGSGNPPDETILGPPTSGLTYTGANNSITNTDPHQPFVMQTATFSLTLSGNLPEGFCICPDVTFFFNTNGTPLTNVPEPAAMLLLGTGLVGVASRLRRRFRKS